jgi:thiamine biosynthesis lipoprotein
VAEHRVEHVMGMPVSIDVRDEVAGVALERAFACLRAADATFSTYRRDSEISRLGRGVLAPAAVSPVVAEVLALCETLRRQTGGFFDARAAGSLDPSGVVKGWAVQRAAQLLLDAGADSFYIAAGGDIALCGEQPWRIGIQHPQRRSKLACVLEMTCGAMATSGAYERGAHVVNPHSGRPPKGVLSVTVLGPDLAIADAYATAAFAMGLAGPAWTASLAGYDAMTILDRGQVLYTPGFRERCRAYSPAASLR